MISTMQEKYQQTPTQVAGNFLSVLDPNPDSVYRQQAVSGHALDHSAIRAGPVNMKSTEQEWYPGKNIR